MQFDDVLNEQRRSIYEKRRGLLLGDREKLDEFLESLINEHEPTQMLVDEKKQVLGEEEFYKIFRRMYLQAMDMLWVEHLEMMDYLRSSVNLRAYGQRDPLVEYKREGLILFKEMNESIEGNVLKLLPGIAAGAYVREQQKLREVHREAQAAGGGNKSSGVQTPIKKSQEDKVGRNDPCPCGAINANTGKVYKYKKCGMIDAPHHKE